MKNIWVPLSGQIAQQRKVETIANNVANANTAGFKKDQLVFKEYLTALDKGLTDIDIPNKEWAPKDFYHTYGAENSKVKVDASYTNHEQGQLNPTGNDFDIGVFGKGFLEVLAPNGVRYTRSGNLTLSKDGELVTREGFKVLKSLEPASSAQGRAQDALSPEERIIKVPDGKFSVAKDGQIFVNNEPISKISVVEFNDLQALKKEGSSLFINPFPENLKREETNTALHQGFIEQSNVNAVHEMSELIKAHRHFESIQKAINAYDNISGRAVNDIAKF